MSPISNVDRLVMILRQRLDERSRQVRSKAKQARSGVGSAPLGLDAVYALAKVDAVDEGQLRRALIQSILSEQFGANLINDAKFQLVVDQVTDSLNSDPNLGPLMARVVSDLRTASRQT